MKRWFSRSPLVGVVIPAYGVEKWLDECLASLVAQTHTRWEAVVVDDGSVDRSGEIADEWARKVSRISVVHTANAGLGAARNVGIGHVRGDYLTFLDSDDLLAPKAFANLVTALEGSGSDFATSSLCSWVSRDPSDRDGPIHEPPWMKRLHNPPMRGARIAQRPELLGDVFAWNKLYRRSWWDELGLSWPEGTRYEDQPTTTRAFMAGTFDVLNEQGYLWRIREGSITQTRATIADLTDRWETKRMSYAAVRAGQDRTVESVFVDRVLAGDLWRYFLLVPDCSDEWWALLRDGVREFWGQRSLVHSGLPPVHRLCGWLVEQDRRADAAALMAWVATLDGPAPQTGDAAGRHIDVPNEVLDLSTVDAAALALRNFEIN